MLYSRIKTVCVKNKILSHANINMWLQTRILSVTTLSINSSKMFSVLKSKRVHVHLVDLATWKLLDKKNNHNKFLYKCDLLGETVTSVPWPRDQISQWCITTQSSDKNSMCMKNGTKVSESVNSERIAEQHHDLMSVSFPMLKKRRWIQDLFKCYSCSCALSVLTHHSLTNI